MTQINETLEFNVIARKTSTGGNTSYYTYGHYRNKVDALKAVKYALEDLGMHKTVLTFMAEDGEQNEVMHATRHLNDGRYVKVEVAIISNQLTLEA